MKHESPPTIGQLIELTIDSIAFGGDGIGRFKGFVVFVPFTAPGDRIRCKVDSIKRNFGRARIIEILEPSSNRIEPTCKFYENCGGCHMQHIDYNEQLKIKSTSVDHRIFSTSTWKGIAGSQKPYGYRNHLALKGQFRKQEIALGFYKRKSHTIVPIDHCSIASPEINKFITALLETLSNKSLQIKKPSDATFEMYITEDGGGFINVWVATVHHHGFWTETLSKLSDSVRMKPSISKDKPRIARVFGVNGMDQLPQYSLSVQNRTLQMAFSPFSFIQRNFLINQQIVTYVHELIGQVGPQTIVDCFCGVGNFTLPAATFAEKVIGLESDPESISILNHNANANGIKNASGIVKNIGTEGWLDVINFSPIDLVIVDPPRSGLDNAIIDDLTHVTSSIIYVSCDPKTMIRDLEQFEKRGFYIKEHQCFDAFSQTFHIETVALLKLTT